MTVCQTGPQGSSKEAGLPENSLGSPAEFRLNLEGTRGPRNHFKPENINTDYEERFGGREGRKKRGKRIRKKIKKNSEILSNVIYIYTDIDTHIDTKQELQQRGRKGRYEK